MFFSLVVEPTKQHDFLLTWRMSFSPIVSHKICFFWAGAVKPTNTRIVCTGSAALEYKLAEFEDIYRLHTHKVFAFTQAYMIGLSDVTKAPIAACSMCVWPFPYGSVQNWEALSRAHFLVLCFFSAPIPVRLWWPRWLETGNIKRFLYVIAQMTILGSAIMFKPCMTLNDKD